MERVAKEAVVLLIPPRSADVKLACPASAGRQMKVLRDLAVGIIAGAHRVGADEVAPAPETKARAGSRIYERPGRGRLPGRLAVAERGRRGSTDDHAGQSTHQARDDK